MSAINYQAVRTRRLDTQAMQKLLARAGLVSIAGGPLLAIIIVCVWFDSRLTRFEQATAANGLMAVIDKSGNAYDFSVARAGEWQPDEALYFSAIADLVDCTRGLRLPQERGGRSCWLKAFPMLGPSADQAMRAWLTKKFGTDDQTKWQAGMAKLQIEIEILPGSTKSDDGRYRLQWREVERASNRAEIWSGIFAASRVAATREDVALGNAIGLRIDSFTWQRDQVVK